jgi:hypothetical protein
MENQEQIDKDTYIQNRYAAAIEYYWAASRSNKRWYKMTRSLTVIVGALVTLLASLSSSTLIAESTMWTALFALGTPMLAAVLTITAGFSQSFQWGSTWQNMVLTAQQLQNEFDSYLVTPPESRNHAEEANKLNKFIMVESEGFFERMLGGAKPGSKEGESNNNGQNE